MTANLNDGLQLIIYIERFFSLQDVQKELSLAETTVFPAEKRHVLRKYSKS